MVALYDETRDSDAACFDAALDFLVERFPPQRFNKLLEPGIGTGRIALPLAQRGYQVTGTDISGEMLALLKTRLAQSSQSLSLQKADATGLPFSNAAFDIAIAVHLFYFIQEWQRAADEMLRVVKNDGALILMHTGTGQEIPFLNQRYKALCAEQGFAIKTLGVESTRQVVVYLEAAGRKAEWVRDRWQWTQRVQLDQALAHLKARAYSFTTLAPDDVHATAIKRLTTGLRQHHGSLCTALEIPNQVYIVVVLPRLR
jgi:ubiquinone/menaquinone biosynthesis C-methylase UbiE